MRVVWVCLIEEEAVLLVNPGSSVNDGLCKGLPGALTLPPLPELVNICSVERHIFSS